MNEHEWYRYYYNAWGLWGCMPTCIQHWKCKKCGLVRPRPDDNSTPSINGCQGGR